MSGSGDELDDLFSYYLCPVFDGHPGLSPDSSLAYPGEEDVRLSAEEIPEEAPGPDAFVAETGPVDATVGLLGVHGSVEACIGGGLVGPGPGASGHASGNALDLTNIKNSAPMKKQTLKELVDLVSSSDISSTDRNVLSALILRHPEVEAQPEVLPLYSTYNDGLRALASPGVWLYNRTPGAKLKMRTKDDRVVTWDPDFNLGLIVNFRNESGTSASLEENKHALKLHFGGSKHLIDGYDVICLHSEKSRTDVRFKARCYIRVCVSTDATDCASPAEKSMTISARNPYSKVPNLSRQQRCEGTAGDDQSNAIPSGTTREGGANGLSSSTAEEVFGLIPMHEIRQRLQRHDRGAKKEILQHLSSFIMNALSQNDESGDEECERSLGQDKGDESAADVHRKRARKGSAGVSGAHEALLRKCLELASEFEESLSDGESKRDFKCVNDEIERIRNKHENRDENSVPDLALSLTSIQPSEDIYGDEELDDRLGESDLKLYDDYDLCMSKMRNLHVEEGDERSLDIDSQSWEQFKERFAAAKIDIEESQDLKMSPVVNELANKQNSMAVLITFVDKLKETIKAANYGDQTRDSSRGKAAHAAASNRFSKATNEVQKGLKDTSENIAWGAAQAQYNLASIAGNAGPPIQSFMSPEQEQRARMVALFKAVDPKKLELIDKLVEKRGKMKGVIGFRKNGFDQMWKSYKQKWGAEAIKIAFETVEEKKKMFYRLKTLALFAAADLPIDGPEIDGLMKKYSGKYDDMYKLWVSTKKFDPFAIAAAHADALELLDK